MKRNIIFICLMILTFSISAQATTHHVAVASFSFTPQDITVSQGDTVIWTNSSGTHNVHETSTPAVFFSGSAAPAPWTFTWVVGNATPRVYHYQCDPHASMGMTGTVTVASVTSADEHTLLARGYSLSQNYPNPFNSETSIVFEIPIQNTVTLKVYNALGEEVKSLFAGEASAGSHRVAFNASGMSSGLYFYRLETNAGILTRKMIYMK